MGLLGIAACLTVTNISMEQDNTSVARLPLQFLKEIHKSSSIFLSHSSKCSIIIMTGLRIFGSISSQMLGKGSNRGTTGVYYTSSASCVLVFVVDGSLNANQIGAKLSRYPDQLGASSWTI
jgi:hypothetical protein